MTEEQATILRRQFANDPERLKEIFAREALATTTSTTPKRGLTRFNWFMLGLLAPLFLVLFLAWLLIAGIYYLTVHMLRRSR